MPCVSAGASQLWASLPVHLESQTCAHTTLRILGLQEPTRRQAGCSHLGLSAGDSGLRLC